MLRGKGIRSIYWKPRLKNKQVLVHLKILIYLFENQLVWKSTRNSHISSRQPKTWRQGQHRGNGWYMQWIAGVSMNFLTGIFSVTPGNLLQMSNRILWSLIINILKWFWGFWFLFLLLDFRAMGCHRFYQLFNVFTGILQNDDAANGQWFERLVSTGLWHA